MLMVNPKNKFRFKIRSRVGFLIDRVVVSAPSEKEALVRLNQIYPNCQVLEVFHESLQAPTDSFEHIVDLITDEARTVGYRSV